MNAADANASGGKSLIQGLDLIIVSSFPRGRFASVEELLVGEQLLQAETRPDFQTVHESAIEVAVAANDRLGHLLPEVVVREPTDPDDLVDDQRRRHVTARRDED